MADTVVERRPPLRFFCHRCLVEFEDVLQVKINSILHIKTNTFIIKLLLRLKIRYGMSRSRLEIVASLYKFLHD